MGQSLVRHCSLYDTLWNLHTVLIQQNGASLLYVDVHLIHEVTSPQAFGNLQNLGSPVHRPELTLGIPDHNIETASRRQLDGNFGHQVEALICNCHTALIECSEPFTEEQGIVHIVSPERAVSGPGKSVVCGDSHTSTHGAIASLSQGIGTSEVESTLAAQTVSQKRNRNFQIRLSGTLRPGCSPKDVILRAVGLVGSSGGTGYAVEFDGSTGDFSVGSRMTVCNMSIEAGAKFSLMPTDNAVTNYLSQRSGSEDQDRAVRLWKSYSNREVTQFSQILDIDAGNLRPQITWGTSPEMVVAVNSRVPNPQCIRDPNKRRSYEMALNYMSLEPNAPMSGIGVQYIFIGSCTNSRIGDLREAASTVKRIGGKVASGIRGAIVVPGSGLVRKQAEAEGLSRIFQRAGFDWREPGCSLCIAMNQDKLLPLERCISTSNRNFEGRQGELGRTHLVSPTTAALAAMTGKLLDASNLR